MFYACTPLRAYQILMARKNQMRKRVLTSLFLTYLLFFLLIFQSYYLLFFLSFQSYYLLILLFLGYSLLTICNPCPPHSELAIFFCVRLRCFKQIKCFNKMIIFLKQKMKMYNRNLFFDKMTKKCFFCLKSSETYAKKYPSISD